MAYEPCYCTGGHPISIAYYHLVSTNILRVQPGGDYISAMPVGIVPIIIDNGPIPQPPACERFFSSNNTSHGKTYWIGCEEEFGRDRYQGRGLPLVAADRRRIAPRLTIKIGAGNKVRPSRAAW